MAMKRTHRREMLRSLAGAVGAIALTAETVRSASPSSQPAGRPEGVVKPYAFGSRIWVRAEGELFTCYRADAGDKYPYFYPLLGPVSGLPMTEEAGDPYPHHRSIFLGCDRVNGANYWQGGLELGRIGSRGPSAEVNAAGGLCIVDRCDWRVGEGPVMIEDARRFTLSAPAGDCRLIDAHITLTARQDIRITRTNHALFAIRAARSLTPLAGGRLMNADGRLGEQATFGAASAWCGFEARRCDLTESLILMDHPGNPWSPCKWFTRDYGFASPTVFNWLDEAGWRLPAGDSVTLRYRVAAVALALDHPRISELYRAFAHTA